MLLLLILFLVFVMVWSFAAVFLGTAQLILPWTISAAVLAVVASLAVVRGASVQMRRPSLVGQASAFGLTFLFGYLGCALNPPTPAMIPPKDPQAEMLENLIVPTVRPTQENIWEMLPLHLAIAGMCAATGTAILSPLVVQKSGEQDADEKGGSEANAKAAAAVSESDPEVSLHHATHEDEGVFTTLRQGRDPGPEAMSALLAAVREVGRRYADKQTIPKRVASACGTILQFSAEAEQNLQRSGAPAALLDAVSRLRQAAFTALTGVE